MINCTRVTFFVIYTSNSDLLTPTLGRPVTSEGIIKHLRITAYTWWQCDPDFAYYRLHFSQIFLREILHIWQVTTTVCRLNWELDRHSVNYLWYFSAWLYNAWSSISSVCGKFHLVCDNIRVASRSGCYSKEIIICIWVWNRYIKYCTIEFLKTFNLVLLTCIK